VAIKPNFSAVVGFAYVMILPAKILKRNVMVPCAAEGKNGGLAPWPVRFCLLFPRAARGGGRCWWSTSPDHPRRLCVGSCVMALSPLFMCKWGLFLHVQWVLLYLPISEKIRFQIVKIKVAVLFLMLIVSLIETKYNDVDLATFCIRYLQLSSHVFFYNTFEKGITERI
jgi:hypothetical protein